MENNTTLSYLKSKSSEPDSDLFRQYARPMTSKLLETMELAKNFQQGEGDYLYYEKNGRPQRVLDLTGGYGANLLGHRYPRLLAKLQEWHDEVTPNLTQGSIRARSGLLAKKISDILLKETSEGPWITTFSNSGTEAVEAALKHCLIYFQHKTIELGQEIEKEINQSVLALKRLSPEELRIAVRKLRLELNSSIPSLQMNEERKSYFLHQLANAHELPELIELVREVNAKQLGQAPSFVALEKAFHGKTLGALSLTSNENFRVPFYLGEEHNQRTHFVSQYLVPEALEAFFNGLLQDVVILSMSQAGPIWTKHSFSTVAGVLVEPIQGEAGVVPVSPAFIALLKKYSLQQDFLLVFDEIQAGMFRTGTLASGTHTFITPDIHVFSKSLGGGLVKIAATSILQRKYVEEFGLLHTSTFAEDDLSSLIALEVLEILQGEDSPLEDGMKTADYLYARLDWLKNQFPEILTGVRGKGLMLAVEFEDVFREMGLEFKTICNSKMQGYLLASALLNHENLRMSPSLSNNLTLRIQPSIYVNIVQVEELITGLTNLCRAMQARDVRYFLTAIYPHEGVKNEKTPDLQSDYKASSRPLSVFLCHLIDEGHVKNVTRALKALPGRELVKKLNQTRDLSQFEIFHTQTITGENGQEMDIIMLGLAITSEELKRAFMSRQRYKIVQKVQQALDYAKELGATTVGLGQFTSIVSGNGLYLNPRGMNLTTGNALTISMAVRSALRSAEEKKIDLSDATAALVGAAGNIMSVATALMTDHVGKIIMLHHSPIESSVKFQDSTKRILNDVLAAPAEGIVARTIKKFWTKDGDLYRFLEQEEVKKVFIASSKISDMSDADIVLCGANASNGFISLEQFKSGAVIVDVAVPPSIRPEMLARLTEERPDLTYHLGGVAKIPKAQDIDFFMFPLPKNECFACMAETFSIGLSHEQNVLNIGDLNKSLVLEVERLAEVAGFTLGSYKSKNSL